MPRWIETAAELGIVPDETVLHLSIGIARAPQVQAAFEQLLADQQNPSSPRFHQWLTPAEIGQQFGPTQHDLDALTSWIASRGLTVDAVTPSRIVIQVSAPASVVSAAFNVSLRRFLLNGEVMQAPVSEPMLPANLEPVVSYVAGLADGTLHASVAMQPVAMPVPNGLSPQYTSSSGAHYQLPADFNTIYNVAPALASGVNGTGQRVAILAGSRLLDSDISTWESLAALPTYQPTYIVPPGLIDPGQTSDSLQGEATLDFERVYGTAPGAGVDMLVASKALDFTNSDIILNYEVNTLRDPVLNLSYGICEALVSPTYVRNEDAIFSQAAAQGISVFVSSGDSGAAGCEVHGGPPSNSQILSTNAVCASSYVTCVGGTQFSDLTSPSTYWNAGNTTGLLSAKGYIPEGAMNEPLSSRTSAPQIFATGGGVSTVIAKPSWQTGTGVPADGFRDTPDISFSGSLHDGYFSCLAYQGASCANGQGALVFGGTSASAPSMAGIAALLDQKLNGRQGNLNPTLYKLAGSSPNAFHDATPATSEVGSCSTATASTCNNSTPSQTGLTGGLAGYPLTVGYDLATGLGSLNVGSFLAAAGLPLPTGTLTASANPITIKQTVSFTVTLSSSAGTPTGTVQFLSNGTALGSPVALVSGVATTPALSFAPAASYAITAIYSGSATLGSISLPTLTLVVTNPGAVASNATLTVSPATGTSAQTYTFTAKVAPVTTSSTVPTGTVQFAVDGAALGAPVALVGGSATYTPSSLAAGARVVSCAYSGDSAYASSVCNTVVVTVTALTSSTSIQINPVTTPQVGAVVFTATVTGVSGSPTPTGSVALLQGTTNIGSLVLTAGTASGTLQGTATAPFPVGTFPFTFDYSGDALYGASTSPTANLTVVATSFTITPSPGSLTLTRGSSGASVLTYLSVGAFAGSVASSCTATSTNAAATLPTCSLSPSTVTVAAGASASSTLTIGTVSPHAIPGGFVQNHSLPAGRGLPGPGMAGGASLAALLFLLGGRRQRALRRFPALACALVLTAGLAILAGCGSGGSGTGTTPGTYTVTVSGTTSAGSTASTTVSVTVQ